MSEFSDNLPLIIVKRKKIGNDMKRNDYLCIKKKKNMVEATRKATEFVVFCIENTAIKLGISAQQLFHELKRTDGIRSFLYPSYPTLHTQSKEYIVDETIEYIRQHNPNFIK